MPILVGISQLHTPKLEFTASPVFPPRVCPPTLAVRSQEKPFPEKDAHEREKSLVCLQIFMLAT